MTSQRNETDPPTIQELGSLIADLGSELTQAQQRVQKLQARMAVFNRLIATYSAVTHE